MQLISLTFTVFQLEISGNDFNEVQLLNIEYILITFDIFHLEISGNELNELQ